MLIIPLISLYIAAIYVNQDDVAFVAAQDCLDIATKLGDHWAVAKAKQFLAILAIHARNYERAAHLAQEALRSFEENVDRWSVSVLCIEVLSLLAVTLRQFDQAQAWIERGLKAATEIDSKYWQQMAYWQLGYVAALQEQYTEAAVHWRTAMEFDQDMVGPNVTFGFTENIEWGERKLIGEYPHQLARRHGPDPY
jgi:tetratricopeptide (TPR) repeat protein